nr:ribonuclease H-like domain-containing protein [Tanacetum cinerariifolium]
MHKAFPLLEESSHWQYNFPLPVEDVPTARRKEIPLLKSFHCYRNCQSKRIGSYSKKMAYVLPMIVAVTEMYNSMYKDSFDESYNSMLKNPENDRYKTGEGYHAISPPYTRTFMPPKRDLVFNDAPTASESVANVVNVESSINNRSKDMSKTVRPDAHIIEDWISDSEDETEIESVPKQKEPSFVPTSEDVKTHMESIKQMVQKPVWNSAMRVHHQHSVRMTHPHSNRNVVPTIVLTRSRLVSLNAARLVPTVVPQSIMKNPRPVKHVVNKTFKKSIEDMLHLEGILKVELKFNLFSVSQMCDKKNNVLFTDTECVVLSSNYKLPDENHVLLRVPRENNMYNVDLKNVVSSGDLTCLFAKATLDESNGIEGLDT